MEAPALVILLSLLLVTSLKSLCDAQVPAFYIFGDSLIDPGNNKFLLTTAQAAFRPNGIDFDGGRATGRFCNGKTVADLLVEELGLPLTPGYHDPSTTGQVILKGVSFASGGARILNDSNTFLQNVQPLGKQLENFIKTRSQILELFRGDESSTLDHLSRSIFLFAMGSNDFLNYMSNSRSKTPSEFQTEILSAYKFYLEKAYALGARKVFVFGLGPVGCIPSKREGNLLGANGKACDQDFNNLAIDFDREMKQLVISMNANLQGLNMVFGNTYSLFDDLNNNPEKYGFSNANKACCGVSPLKLFACLPAGSVCSNRTSYLYWDAFHPTERANRLVAKAILDGDTTVMYPFNLRKLAEA